MICYVCGDTGVAKGLCRKHYDEKWREHNRARASAKSSKWRVANKKKALSSTAAWRKANPDWEANYRAANPGAMRAKSSAWAKTHPAKVNARNARRHAGKLRATPAWANQFFIDEIYDLAQRRTKALGVKHHVDHIVPLQSPMVCGLHVENNLRVIPALDNISKKNRWWPDMPQLAA